MAAGDFHRCVRCAAEEYRHVRLLRRLYLGVALGKAVVPALMVEWFVLGPDAAQDAEVLVGAGITLVVAEEIAVALLLGIGAAGDEVHA